MATLSAIEKLQRHAKKIASGKDPKVQPGVEAKFTEACTIGDCIIQGDLYITIAESVPSGYVLIEKPTESDKQLVPGNTAGAKHCLDSLAGVEMWRPENWSSESLDGPFIRLARQRTILHPVHGAVIIPAGFAVLCEYQREWDIEQAKERRAAD